VTTEARDVCTSDLVDCMNLLAPPEYAEEGDPIGLQIGRMQDRLDKILVCLTVDEQTVSQAKEVGARLIVAHHPLIYRGLNSMASSTYPVAEVNDLVRSGIGLFVAHTNLDVVPNGVNDALASLLGLEDTRPLKLQPRRDMRKLVVFVPKEALSSVQQAVCEAGAGRIGRYSGCTFGIDGTGTFIPEAGASPTIGRVGQYEEVSEARVETVVPLRYLEAVVRALVAAHPYEEPAFDVYPIESWRADVGYGRIGRLPREVSIESFVELVKLKLGTSALRVYSGSAESVRTVGVCGGSGGDFAELARDQDCDVYVTGETSYHVAEAVSSRGTAVLVTGHAESEMPIVSVLKKHIAKNLPVVKVVQAE